MNRAPEGDVRFREGHVAIEPPPGVPTWDVDPYDVAILTAPDEYHEELRARGAFVYIPRYAVLACGRYREVKEVLADHDRFVSSRGVGLQDFAVQEPWRAPSILLEADPPYHTKTRAAMVRALSPQAITRLRERFVRAAESLVDELVEKRSFEAIAELAEAFPTRVFPDAVGLADADGRRLIDYAAMVFNGLGPDNRLRRDAMTRATEVVPWITASCRRERLAPGGFGEALYSAADAGEITEDEAGMLVRSLLSAGIDTTVAGIGNALWCLASHPEEYDALQSDPGLVRAAFEETLRFTSPVHSVYRTADRDTTVGSTPIPEGAKILCVVGAANLDDRQWPDAHRFRISRRPTGHLTFGTGIHACVGQNLARAEAAALLKAIMQRVDRIEFAGELAWRPNNTLHSLARLPLEFRPK
jgi:cytochrome P450